MGYWIFGGVAVIALGYLWLMHKFGTTPQHPEPKKRP